jgi:hypothetical protein
MSAQCKNTCARLLKLYKVINNTPNIHTFGDESIFYFLLNQWSISHTQSFINRISISTIRPLAAGYRIKRVMASRCVIFSREFQMIPYFYFLTFHFTKKENKFQLRERAWRQPLEVVFPEGRRRECGTSMTTAEGSIWRKRKSRVRYFSDPISRIAAHWNIQPEHLVYIPHPQQSITYAVLFLFSPIVYFDVKTEDEEGSRA